MIDVIDFAEHLAKTLPPRQEVLAVHAEGNSCSGLLRRAFEKGYGYAPFRICQEQWPFLRRPMFKLADSGQSKNSIIPRFSASAIRRVHVDVVDTFEFGRLGARIHELVPIASRCLTFPQETYDEV